MSLGKLKCFVKNLHIGSLKTFGFKSAIMPEVIIDVTQEMLDDPQIKAAITAGVITFEAFDAEMQVEEPEEIKTVPIISEPYGDPVTPEEEEEFRQQLETDEVDFVDESDDDGVELEEVFETLVDKVNNGQATDEDIEILFNIINNMNGFDAQKAVKRINDNVPLLDKLANHCKFAKVQAAARKKLESIQES